MQLAHDTGQDLDLAVCCCACVPDVSARSDEVCTQQVHAVCNFVCGAALACGCATIFRLAIGRPQQKHHVRGTHLNQRKFLNSVMNSLLRGLLGSLRLFCGGKLREAGSGLCGRTLLAQLADPDTKALNVQLHFYLDCIMARDLCHITDCVVVTSS